MKTRTIIEFEINLDGDFLIIQKREGRDFPYTIQFQEKKILLTEKQFKDFVEGLKVLVEK